MLACNLSFIMYLFCLKMSPPVVHLDVKPSNILLDNRMTAKVADVGLARTMNSGLSFEQVSVAVGFLGYCDPSFMEERTLSRSCDVYSLGQVIWDILAGISPDGGRGKARGSLQKLREAVKVKNSTGFIEQLDRSAGEWPFDLAWTLALLATDCCKHNRKERPLIQKVVETLRELQNNVCL